MKKNKLLWTTTIICFLPLILSVMLYNKLPELVPIHFNYQGVPNNYAPKSVGAFGLPVLMAVINIFTHFKLNNDPKKMNSPEILKYLGKWSAPILSVILVPVTLFIALGYKIPIQIISLGIVGVILVATGNYLPKCRQNYTVGIRLPWTLNSEVNWNKTHHMAGYLWILGGIFMIIGGCIQVKGIPLTLLIILIIVIVPCGYSYWLYKKGI
ncbi:SdpI family protein [Clostridium sp. BL-8]|uniref:SdpI family protein n=1 Tax=Clostridium sp. BL-8 TaxID=349938 RepID=UPI00098BFFB3|nr:SdpI family protein [Clostridium sp. BL-8]OOM80892.1 immunity protein SdpI [Clostridium sp. BL-8]